MFTEKKTINTLEFGAFHTQKIYMFMYYINMKNKKEL